MGKADYTIKNPAFAARSFSFPLGRNSNTQRYTLLPQKDEPSSPRAGSLQRSQRLRCRPIYGRVIRWLVIISICAGLITIRHNRSLRQPFSKEIDGVDEDEVKTPAPPQHHWLAYPRTDGFYSGLKTIVSMSEYIPEYLTDNDTYAHTSVVEEPKPSATPKVKTTIPRPVVFDPYPNYTSPTYLARHHPVTECWIDEERTVPAPNIFAYHGRPQNQPKPLMGSHETLGLQEDVCFDRFGRLGPYGFGYHETEGGTGTGLDVESEGSSHIWSQLGERIDYRDVDWAKAQTRCYESNKQRFEATIPGKSGSVALKPVSRSAVVIRSWYGYKWQPYAIMNFRAMINELSLRSGGEYDVHFLVHVKDNSIPIFASDEVYQEVVNASVPPEFRGMVTLWTEKQMEMIYAGLNGPNFENDSRSPIHGAYRSLHLPLQYFAHTHPEYDYFWNWEMDMRYTGHFYELFERMASWGKDQPRQGMWQRNAKYYIPGLHGTWDEFSDIVRQENPNHPPITGPLSIPGIETLAGQDLVQLAPNCAVGDDLKLCGVGEEVDLITFNPMFDPEGSGWVFEKDVTGYSLDQPIPPRRTAIVTAGRLSKRLLQIMHLETFDQKHSMFAEMWPPSVALHHGLKAVFAPHPVYFDRAWPMGALEEHFNAGLYHSTGGNGSSPFAQKNEHNYQGSTWYYNAGFSGAFWRRWLGHAENGEGGREVEEMESSRMCLPSTLLHPIKYEHAKIQD